MSNKDTGLAQSDCPCVQTFFRQDLKVDPITLTGQCVFTVKVNTKFVKWSNTWHFKCFENVKFHINWSHIWSLWIQVVKVDKCIAIQEIEQGRIQNWKKKNCWQEFSMYLNFCFCLFFYYSNLFQQMNLPPKRLWKRYHLSKCSEVLIRSKFINLYPFILELGNFWFASLQNLYCAIWKLEYHLICIFREN